MSHLALVLGVLWLAAVTWLILRAVRQYGKYEMLSPVPPPPQATAPSVHVIVPARNEAKNIGRCLSGLLAQDYPRCSLRITVVDDGSTDQTASITSSLAVCDDRIQLRAAADPLPAGWTGKPHACWPVAAEATADWLCFIDADTTPEPSLIGTAVRTAHDRGIDLLSLEPFQVLGTFWERLILPTGFFLIAFSQDLGRVDDPAAPDAVANGQFLLFRREVYEAIGGHAAVRGEISEDSALARLVKRSGHRLAVLGAEKLISTRMYDGLAPLWEGLGKNATEVVGGVGPMILFGIAGLALAWATLLLPLWLLTMVMQGGATLAVTAGLLCAMIATAAMFGVHVGAAIHFRIPFWYGLLFPAAYTVGAALAFHSASLRLRRAPLHGRAGRMRRRRRGRFELSNV